MLWSLGQGRQDSGWIREEGWAHLDSWSRVSSLQLSGPAPDSSSLLQPLAPAPAPALLLFMGPGWGGGGPQHQLPPPAQTDWEGEEGRGRDTGWEGATELGEEGGLGAGQKQDPHRHSDTHLLHITPTPGITETHTHIAVVHAHTHIHTEEGWQHTHPRLTGSHIS